jgi:hypothetical protein
MPVISISVPAYNTCIGSYCFLPILFLLKQIYHINVIANHGHSSQNRADPIVILNRLRIEPTCSADVQAIKPASQSSQVFWISFDAQHLGRYRRRECDCGPFRPIRGTCATRVSRTARYVRYVSYVRSPGPRCAEHVAWSTVSDLASGSQCPSADSLGGTRN